MVPMKAIRVLHVVPHLQGGGAERLAVHLMRGLGPGLFDVAAISLGGASGSDLERMLVEHAIPVQFLNKKPGFDPRMFTRVHRALREFSPDVIHTHGGVLRYTLPSMLYDPAPAMVHTVHNLAEKEVEPRARWLQKLAFRKGVIPVAIAREVAASLARTYGITDSVIIPNCIPVEVYSTPRTSREEWRSREKFAREDVLFVCVGYFRPQKNHALLLEAFARGPACHPRARLVLVGTGELREKLEAQVERLGVKDKVRFLGSRADIPNLLGAMDAFVLASDWEGNPLAVLEAMAAGLPVISTAVGGVPELVESAREGLIVPCGNAQALADAMLHLLEDAPARRAMGQAAAKRAKENYGIPRMVVAYASLYVALLSHARNGRRFSLVPTPVTANSKR